MSVNERAQFNATVQGTNNNGIEWSIREENGGTIYNGSYVAPEKRGIYHVIATSAQDTAKMAVITVTVQAGDASGVIE